tara:strand:- start:648 stop:869 length:222 start_codon:yes stop_codon:yes gene_type:complete
MSNNFCTINGTKFQIEKEINNLYILLLCFFKVKKLNLSIAVAVNEELVQKSEWKKKVVKNGDRVEIVQPFFGG